MNVVEHYINSKSGNLETCEDVIFIGEHYVAIIDGATSNSGKLWDGKTSGRIAAELLRDELSTFPADLDVKEAVRRLNLAIFSWYERQKVSTYMQKNPSERAIASIVVYMKQQRKIFMVGDCQCILGTRVVTNVKQIDTLLENVRSFYLETQLIEGKTIEELLDRDVAREMITPFLIKQSSLQNTTSTSEYAFTVLDGFFFQTDSIKVISIPKDVSTLVLASDGYPELKSTLAGSEARLASILANDPLCFRLFRSTKGVKKGNISFDDRSYIRFSI